MGERLAHIIDLINDRVGNVFAWIAIPIMLITTFEVTSRYVFNRPTGWAWDINVQLAAALLIFGAGYTLLKQGHVKVDVIINRFSPRTRAIIDMITSSLFFLCIGLLVWKSWEQGIRSVQIQEVSINVRVPVFPLKMAVPVAAFLLFLQGVAKFIRDLGIARSGSTHA